MRAAFLLGAGILLLLGTILLLKPFGPTHLPSALLSLPVLPSPQPTPTPKALKFIDRYEPPIIPRRDAYTVLFVGDSMTESLGPNFDALRPLLQTTYPDTAFGLFNYGYGSSNILSVQDRLSNDTTYQGQTNPAIFSRDFEVIIIESFGHNPLSEHTLEEGLRLQTHALDLYVAQLVDAKPGSLIVFLATIAPSQSHYALNTVDLSPAVRTQWANERRFYIENHINYALKHNIPLINVYAKSLDPQGRALLQYINSADYIHPSTEGIQLISAEAAAYLNQVLPK